MIHWVDLSGAELRARLRNRSECKCEACLADIEKLVRLRDHPKVQKRITALLKKS